MRRMKAYTQEEQDVAADETLPHWEVAEQIGRSYLSVFRYRQANGIDVPDGRGKRWSAEDDESLIKWHTNGDSRKKIAYRIDRSQASVMNRLVILKKKGKI